MEPEVVAVSYHTLVIVFAVAWLSIGLTLSLVMGRRGHDAFSWLILGTLFGPLAAIFAVEARGEERLRPELVAPRPAAPTCSPGRACRRCRPR